MVTQSLYDLTTLDCNNDNCVILNVKENTEIDLIRLGCFNGDETMFRLTKGNKVTCTVFTKNDKHYSWYWGDGYTLVSDALWKRGQMIQKCIEKDYGIKCLYS
jgi:hypothetical protein